MDKRVVLILVIAALVIAVASAAVFFYLQNREKYPPGTYETNINDTTILVESDPVKQVKLVSTTNSGQGGQSANTQNADTAATQAALLALTPVTPTPQPATATPIPPVSSNDHIFVPYTVVAGDTLYSIANNGNLNTTIALMARYGISAPDIYAGNTLNVPVANPAKCPGSFPYVIREGDTLYSISVKCGTTVDTLKELNGISGDNYRLDETDVLCVPNQPS